MTKKNFISGHLWWSRCLNDLKKENTVRSWYWMVGDDTSKVKLGWFKSEEWLEINLAKKISYQENNPFYLWTWSFYIGSPWGCLWIHVNTWERSIVQPLIRYGYDSKVFLNSNVGALNIFIMVAHLYSFDWWLLWVR